ncbi:MAG: ATP-binding protein [Nitrospirae bacterium]|nr:MAG: ATP-binding protein [Nitrospirota bacterium]
MEHRNLYINLWKELAREKSMIFLAGPRQSGKTTLSKMIANTFINNFYFNWDIQAHKTMLLENPAFFESVARKDTTTPLIILDEIHKYRDWKNYLKGVYDQFHEEYSFIVSGSGRLDLYQKGGDSMAGRYFLMHLWPFTIAELADRNTTLDEFVKDPLFINMENNEALKEIWNLLSEFSGFPEPYLSGRVTTYRRWSNTYANQLIKEDIRDLTEVKSVGDVEMLYLMLPLKVGSPISIPSLARDLKVSYNSVQSWLAIFERFFMVFSLSPWTPKINRAIQKERKVYLWDFPRIKEPSARFENMVAVELWRAVTVWNDIGYGSFSLHFVRNKEHQETDFLLADNGEPFLLIEAKLSDNKPSPALLKFQKALNIDAVQLTNEGETFRLISNGSRSVLVAPAYQWLARLP